MVMIGCKLCGETGAVSQYSAKAGIRQVFYGCVDPATLRRAQLRRIEQVLESLHVDGGRYLCPYCLVIDR
jgi:hypothetical protein